MTKMLRRRKGFTLIELIVVIAVLAILAAVLLPRYMGFTESARKSATLSDCKNLGTAFEAMLAEDPTQTITGDDIEEYAGSTGHTFPGSIADASIDKTNHKFTYVRIGFGDGKTYTAAYDDGTITVTVS